MNSLKRKRKLEPVVKIKQADVDRELMVLQELLAEVTEAERSMEHFQSLYREGSARVNELRLSGDRSMLVSVEMGVDLAKSNWASSFKVLKESRLKADAQRMLVLELRKELKAVEFLVGKYENDFLRERSQADQNQLDEFSSSNQIRKGMRGF